MVDGLASGFELEMENGLLMVENLAEFVFKLPLFRYLLIRPEDMGDQLWKIAEIGAAIPLGMGALVDIIPVSILLFVITVVAVIFAFLIALLGSILALPVIIIALVGLLIVGALLALTGLVIVLFPVALVGVLIWLTVVLVLNS